MGVCHVNCIYSSGIPSLTMLSCLVEIHKDQKVNTVTKQMLASSKVCYHESFSTLTK